MKRLIALTLSLLLLAACAAPAGAGDQSPLILPSDPVASSVYANAPDTQNDAVMAHSALSNTFLVPGSVEEVFPDNYAGSYIKDNILHIGIVDLPSQDISDYKTLLADWLHVIVFVDKDHSLASLLANSDTIADQLRSQGVTVYGWSVSERHNAVTVDAPERDIVKLGLRPAVSWTGDCYIADFDLYAVPVLFYVQNEPDIAA